ncbi:Ferritin-like [Bradyrhizobium yuanmingense]|uniref:Ferritin-like n=1 Tax=Bradyrhizobium yuanmingense TaxID=108015 RepID=A0A1C3XMK4_9BRAD|nr:ferritin-like domain-containing protein [Bradyrhizobium yuanmingense]TWI16087.1 ferritin-like protein [Bradyrhizobium yuanmingense]SCB53503.1 Ferritin-like [Bradyrhizobium yuanmingense]
MPTHDPPLAPRDEAAFLLHIAAEIEHALMVQYLYSAYSLNPNAIGLSPSQSAQVADWKRTILAIAKEEMAHFISVQNILISLGLPLNFERDSYPFRSQFYPFEFKLEPLTIRRRKSIKAAVKASKGDAEKIAAALFSASLNRYIAAEMPALNLISDAERALVETLTHGEQVNRVGKLYERLLDLFDAGPTAGLRDSDFDGERLDAQGYDSEWGGKDQSTISFHALVRPVRTRAEARALLTEIAEQGEGHQEGAVTSHFQRFLTIFKQLEQFSPTQVYLHSIATNPTTSELATEATIIANPRTRRWAQLLNLRYRLLLGYLWHFLSLGGELFTDVGDRTPHGWLVIATFMEMSNLKAISELLVGLDLDAPGGPKAGPTFELPYGLALPDREKDRWRRHIDVLTTARALADQLQKSIAPAADSEAAMLVALAERDDKSLADLEELRKGNHPLAATGFAKVRQILDEGLRGFPLAQLAHSEFWRVDDETKLRDVAGFPPLRPGDGANSNIIKALKGEAPFGADLGTPGGALPAHASRASADRS